MYLAIRHCGTSALICASAIVACNKLPPPEAPTRTRAVAHELVLVHQPKAAFEGVPWASRSQVRQSAAITGNPVAMTFGARCVHFRSLPGVEFRRNTLIQDACIEIPSGTTIVVQSGATLGIVATNGLRVGRNVKFSAKGIQGARGERADFGAISFSPDTDVEINAACVDNGNRCSCPTNNLSATAIRGHSGASGTPGGALRLVIGALVSPNQLSGFEIDVTGGRGGPPGESGRQECSRGAIKCSSENCSNGASSGGQGEHGSIYIALGGGRPDKLLRALNEACTPLSVVAVIPIASKLALDAEVRAINDQAYQNDWDRRAGRDSI